MVMLTTCGNETYSEKCIESENKLLLLLTRSSQGSCYSSFNAKNSTHVAEDCMNVFLQTDSADGFTLQNVKYMTSLHTDTICDAKHLNKI